MGTDRGRCGRIPANRPRLPPAGGGWSWESREAREKNIPHQGRGKEILIPMKRRESNPNHDMESCFMVDHIHLADNLEGGELVGQEENSILRWSHLFALQGCGPGRVHTYLPTTFLFCTTSHRLCWKVVRCLTEVPPRRGDNPPFLFPGGGHSFILKPMQETSPHVTWCS